MSPGLELRGVTKRFGPTLVCDRLDLEVEHGEVLALIGPSGCGKTTALRLIAGFERPDAGTVRVGGREVAGAGHLVAPERRAVGLVFQQDACFPHLSVAANVCFGLRRASRGERARRAGELLELVGLPGLGGRYPHELSGGQRQRVAIARALAPRPAVILLDEPFAHLDAILRAGLRTEIGRILKEANATAVLVTHDQKEALATADRLAVMGEGQILQIGSPSEVFFRPASPFVAAALGDADLLAARAAGGGLETEIGRLAALEPPDDGARVAALIRPDEVEVWSDAEGPARVVAREFLGGEVNYTIALPSGATMRSHGRHRQPLEPGERVRLRVTDAPVAWFAADGELAQRGGAIPVSGWAGAPTRSGTDSTWAPAPASA